ncbi:MAG: hypothetical protein O6928_05315 [Gammaproteobacteria bacterium]|nr:hypothetical protein [Gammaproteobacteria bacterium]
MNKMLHEGFTFAIGQDKEIVEGQVSRLPNYEFTPDDKRVSLAGDQVTGACRVVIKKLMEQEQTVRIYSD